MRYREIGNTGLRVSEVGFGCGGTAGLMIRGSFQDQVRTIDRALELGINYFDESPDYGDGVSEENLGKVCRELGVRPTITTKVEIRPGDMDDIAGHVERSVDASLKRLGVDWVDIIQIHNGPTPDKPQLGPREYRVLWVEDYFRAGGAIEGLERIQRAGKTRFVGFICRGGDGRQVRHLLDTGRFSLINLVYHALNPSAAGPLPPGMTVADDFGGAIASAQVTNAGVAIYSPLAGGFLTDDAVTGASPHPLSGSRRASAAADLAKHQASRLSFLRTAGRSLAQAAYRFILDHPGVTAVLGGFSDQKQLEELCAASGAASLTEEERVRMEVIWRANFGRPAAGG